VSFPTSGVSSATSFPAVDLGAKRPTFPLARGAVPLAPDRKGSKMTREERLEAAFTKLTEASELLVDAGEHDLASTLFKIGNEVATAAISDE
jgi:hypothetical protein